MNISLSPADNLSRMIYSFNASAYEIDENNKANLEKYSLLSSEKIVPTDNIYTIGQKNLTAGKSVTYKKADRLEILIN
jgi:putative salt-induced outer membrane protein YdiY